RAPGPRRRGVAAADGGVAGARTARRDRRFPLHLPRVAVVARARIGPAAMKVSVVVPLLNEQDNLRPLHARLVATLDGLGVAREIIFVDDGSTDASLRVIEELAASDPSVIGISLSRNFGHEPASTAGL